MTIMQAVRELAKEYERALHLDYVRNPIAYALYQVWKKADAEGDKNDYQRSTQNP